MTNEKLNRFTKLNKQANLGGGKEKISQQHKKNKLTARERINLLLDENSFVEIDKFVVHNNQNFDMDKKKILGDGVVTGYGTINNKKIFVFANDFTVLGGSLSVSVGKKIYNWGSVDENSPIDILNAHDNYYLLIGNSERKLGSYSISFDYYINLQKEKNVDFIGYYINNDTEYPVIENWFFGCTTNSKLVHDWKKSLMKSQK